MTRMLQTARRRVDRVFRSPRLLIAAIVLIAEVGNCFWQHLGDTRYFAWAPNDYAVTYDLRVTVDGRRLTTAEASRRYRLDLMPINRLNDSTVKEKLGLLRRERFLWEDPPQRLIDRLKWYEQRGGAANPARVTLVYQLDGGRPRDWRWPQR